jgi:hypothetical protein
MKRQEFQLLLLFRLRMNVGQFPLRAPSRDSLPCPSTVSRKGCRMLHVTCHTNVGATYPKDLEGVQGQVLEDYSSNSDFHS